MISCVVTTPIFRRSKNSIVSALKSLAARSVYLIVLGLFSDNNVLFVCNILAYYCIILPLLTDWSSKVSFPTSEIMYSTVQRDFNLNQDRIPKFKTTENRRLAKRRYVQNFVSKKMQWPYLIIFQYEKGDLARQPKFGLQFPVFHFTNLRNSEIRYKTAPRVLLKGEFCNREFLPFTRPIKSRLSPSSSCYSQRKPT